VRLAIISELNIYLYMSGQILRSSNINRFSLANRENLFPIPVKSVSMVEFFESEISINIENIDFSEIQGPGCLLDQQLYDQCMFSQFTEKHNKSFSLELFFKDVFTWSQNVEGDITEVIPDFFATMNSLDAVNKCPKSCNYFQVHYEQKIRKL